MKPGDAGIVHTYFGVAHGLPRCVALLRAEIDRLRAALIKAGRAAGAQMTDEVSTDFLMHVPDEVEAKIFALSEECSRQPEPAADPQEPADPGQGIDIPSPVKSSGVQDGRDFEIPTHMRFPLIGGMPDTPNDTPKTAIPEPVPPRTLEGDSETSGNGTQLSEAELAIVIGSLDPVVLQIEDPDERIKALREFMRDALQFHLVGAEHMLAEPIRAMDCDGKEFLVSYEMGEPDVNIGAGWNIEPAEAE